MTIDDLLQHLRELEVALHQPEIRRDRTRLNELLHDSFSEFGRSGRSYSKSEILELLSHEVPLGTIWSQDFKVAEIAEGIALLTYRSVYIDANGELGRHTLRSSLWQRTAGGWRMRVRPQMLSQKMRPNIRLETDLRTSSQSSRAWAAQPARYAPSSHSKDRANGLKRTDGLSTSPSID